MTTTGTRYDAATEAQIIRDNTEDNAAALLGVRPSTIRTLRRRIPAACPACRTVRSLTAFARLTIGHDKVCRLCRTAAATALARRKQREADARTAKPATSDWRHQALCRDEDPELFHPVGNSDTAIAQAEKAKAVCGRCPSRDACFAWAMTNNESGVFGGTTDAERTAMKRRGARLRAAAKNAA